MRRTRPGRGSRSNLSSENGATSPSNEGPGAESGPRAPPIPLYLILREILILSGETAPNRLTRSPQRLTSCFRPLALPAGNFRIAPPMNSKRSLRNSAARHVSPLSVRLEHSERVEHAHGSRPALTAEQAARVAGASVLPGTPARSAYAPFVTTRILNVALPS